MAERGSTLVLVGIILQFLFTVILLVLAFIVPPYIVSIDDIFWGSLRPLMASLFQGFSIAGAIVGLILAFIWLVWRKAPTEHRTGFIGTGVIGLLFAGFIPGLIVLIGGQAISREVA